MPSCWASQSQRGSIGKKLGATRPGYIACSMALAWSIAAPIRWNGAGSAASAGGRVGTAGSAAGGGTPVAAAAAAASGPVLVAGSAAPGHSKWLTW